MIAPASALTAMPVRTSVITSVRPLERETAYTAITVMKPPTKAATLIVQVPAKEKPSTIWPTAPITAPDETPTTPGSASGFENVPCIAAPAQPSDAPTSIVSTTRGNRICHSTSSSSCWRGGPISSPTLSAMEPMTCPGVRA